MVSLETPVCGFDQDIVDFSLPGVDGKVWTPELSRGENGLLVMFICNHCPFVKHVADELAAIGHEYMPKGVGMVAINSNDVAAHPADSPEQMVHESEQRGYPFPYLFDETQEVAKTYGAACTPDFYLFDGNHKVVYRGQLYGSRTDSGVPVTGEDLRKAIDALLESRPLPQPQLPSIGCNIKWRPGNEPQYFLKP